MPLYSFHRFCADAEPLPVIRRELPTDLAALRYSPEVLISELSAALLTIIEDGRHVAHIRGPAGRRSILALNTALDDSRACIDRSLDLLQRTAT